MSSDANTAWQRVLELLAAPKAALPPSIPEEKKRAMAQRDAIDRELIVPFLIRMKAAGNPGLRRLENGSDAWVVPEEPNSGLIVVPDGRWVYYFVESNESIILLGSNDVGRDAFAFFPGKIYHLLQQLLHQHGSR